MTHATTKNSKRLHMRTTMFSSRRVLCIAFPRPPSLPRLSRYILSCPSGVFWKNLKKIWCVPVPYRCFQFPAPTAVASCSCNVTSRITMKEHAVSKGPQTRSSCILGRCSTCLARHTHAYTSQMCVYVRCGVFAPLS